MAHVLAGEKVPEASIETWLQGSAAFWREDHYYQSWGLHLPSAVEEEDIAVNGIREATLSADDWFRYKFGSILLQAQSGEKAIAITAHSGFRGDSLFGFFADEKRWRQYMAETGWLLGGDRTCADAVATRSDGDLLELWKRDA